MTPSSPFRRLKVSDLRDDDSLGHPRVSHLRLTTFCVPLAVGLATLCIPGAVGPASASDVPSCLSPGDAIHWMGEVAQESWIEGERLGDRLYVLGSRYGSPGVVIHEVVQFDVSDPLHPVALHRVEIDDAYHDLTVDDGVVFLRENDNPWGCLGTWCIVDFRSPSPFELEGLSPRIDWGETASLALLASDDRLYSVNAFNCDQVRLDIFDTHDPQHVFDGLGTVDLPSTGSEEHAGIAVVSNYVVVATTPGDVMVVDVSDPTSPEYVAGVQIPQGSRRIVRYGDYLLLLGDDVPMEVVDVSDPLVPTYISSADLIGWGGVLHEDRLYVPGSGKVGVYDLADVLDPVFVGDFSASGDPDRVEFYGNLLYTGPALLGSDFPEENPRGFEIYDVSSGAVGLPVTTLSTDGTPVSIAESGNRCVVARGTSGLAVVDLTDPLSPVLLPGAVLGDFLEVDVEGNLVAALTPSELCLFDLSSTGGLLPRGTLSFGTGVWQVHLSGSICALRNETVIRIVDVSSPDVPVEVSDVSLGGSYLSVSGETLAATNFDGVHIYSLANPSQPSLLVDLPIEYVPSWCGVDENLLFVSKWAFNEVQVFDLTEPTAPALITNINLPGLESSVIRNGSHLFIQTKESAVTAWDVSDMESPSQIYTVRSPGIELGGVVVDGHPVGFDSGGLVIFPSVCEETSDVGSDGSVVSASDSPGRWSLRVSPSPSLGGAIEFSWPTSTTERRAIQVFDAAGRAVASVPVTQGVGSVVWNPSDLVDPLPSGTYWATWAKAQSEAVRFVVVQ